MRDAGINPAPHTGRLAEGKTGPRAAVEQLLDRANVEVIVNTHRFRWRFEDGEGRAGALGRDVPVLQAIVSGGTEADWRAQSTGLSPRDLAMSVVLPEVDGRIITRAVTFKGAARRSERAQIDVAAYRLAPDRAASVAALAARGGRLASTPRSDAQDRAGARQLPEPRRQARQGVGLDTPASVVTILAALGEAGYDVGTPPYESAALMRMLLGNVTNASTSCRRGRLRMASRSRSNADFSEPAARSRRAVNARWGAPQRDPRVRAGRIVVSGGAARRDFLRSTPRGLRDDVGATYHDAELVPPHAISRSTRGCAARTTRTRSCTWARTANPRVAAGKSVALSNAWLARTPCRPAARTSTRSSSTNPGEGTPSQRRAQAVVIDHLVPHSPRARPTARCAPGAIVDEY